MDESLKKVFWENGKQRATWQGGNQLSFFQEIESVIWAFFFFNGALEHCSVEQLKSGVILGREPI